MKHPVMASYSVLPATTLTALWTQPRGSEVARPVPENDRFRHVEELLLSRGRWFGGRGFEFAESSAGELGKCHQRPGERSKPDGVDEQDGGAEGEGTGDESERGGERHHSSELAAGAAFGDDDGDEWLNKTSADPEVRRRMRAARSCQGWR